MLSVVRIYSPPSLAVARLGIGALGARLGPPKLEGPHRPNQRNYKNSYNKLTDVKFDLKKVKIVRISYCSVSPAGASNRLQDCMQEV